MRARWLWYPLYQSITHLSRPHCPSSPDCRRGRSDQSLAGLRKRIAQLFLDFIYTPEFNPEAAKFLRAPPERSQGNTRAAAAAGAADSSAAAATAAGGGMFVG